MTRDADALSFEEINRQYDGEWLLVRVVASERDRITQASVVAHDPDREKIAAMLPRSQEQQPRPSLAFFRARAQ